MLSLLLGFPFPTEKVDLITGSTRRPRAPTTELWASGGAPALTTMEQKHRSRLDGELVQTDREHLWKCWCAVVLGGSAMTVCH